MIQDLIGQRLIRHGTEQATYVPMNETKIDRVVVVSLRFSSSSIQLENPFRVEANDGGSLKLDAQIGKLVKEVQHYENDELRIIFSDRSIISISLRDEDYCTPEALSYYPDKGTIVVFN